MSDTDIVTRAMIDAGMSAALASEGYPGDLPYQDHTISEIYRAMERARREECRAARTREAGAAN